MPVFNIIIPTCHRESVLEEAVNSIVKQTFKYWDISVVHDNEPNPDNSTNKTTCGYYPRTDYYILDKVGAGGARNIGIDNTPKLTGYYTLFLDDDDILANNTVLEELNNFIIDNDYPDMVRMGYIKHFIDSGIRKLKLIDPKEKDILQATMSNRVSGSCKAVKNTLIQKFPVGVKHQDVVQHIAQCDVCKTCAVWNKPFFIYNLYDRPDKHKNSLESQAAKNTIPDILRSMKFNRPESEMAARIWARKIERLYS